MTLDSPGRSTGKYIWDGASIHGGLVAMDRLWLSKEGVIGVDTFQTKRFV